MKFWLTNIRFPKSSNATKLIARIFDLVFIEEHFSFLDDRVSLLDSVRKS